QAILGLHPVYLARHRPQHLDDLRQWLQRLRGETKLCAVGEIGLDYYLEHLDRDAQQALFEAQLRLAAEFRLPAKAWVVPRLSGRLRLGVAMVAAW
ncbi:TatD family hydrolase, partial [Pseudomonas aeruginosa]